MDNKNSIGYKVGYAFGIVLTGCVSALIIAFTIKLIILMLF